MTPNDIEILIHCHVCPSVHPRISAPAVNESITQFCIEGILAVDDEKLGTFKTTDKGAALMRSLCDTPYPKQAWIDQTGKIIEV